MWLLLVPWLAHAEVPLPSYREDMAEDAWYAMNAKVEAGLERDNLARSVDDDGTLREEAKALYREAIAWAEAYEAQVLATAGLAHLRGLAWRYLDEPAKAEEAFHQSVARDPDYAAPWSDLGELAMADGRWADAREAFTKVSELRASGEYAWLGPIRLAEVAAFQKDTTAFEQAVRDALSRGWSIRKIEGDDRWRGFYADPDMRGSVEKLVLVYGDRSLLESIAVPGG